MTKKYQKWLTTIFEDYFGNGNPKKKLLETIETEGKHTLVIPKFSPTAAMDFLCRRAVVSDFRNSTQMIRFFETRKGFFFTSHDDLNAGFTEGIPNAPGELRYQYSSKASYGEDGGGDNLQQTRLMQEILEFEFPEHVNTSRDIKDGAYKRRVSQLDFINRSLGGGAGSKNTDSYLRRQDLFIDPRTQSNWPALAHQGKRSDSKRWLWRSCGDIKSGDAANRE